MSIHVSTLPYWSHLNHLSFLSHRRIHLYPTLMDFYRWYHKCASEMHLRFATLNINTQFWIYGILNIPLCTLSTLKVSSRYPKPWYNFVVFAYSNPNQATLTRWHEIGVHFFPLIFFVVNFFHWYYFQNYIFCWIFPFSQTNHQKLN